MIYKKIMYFCLFLLFVLSMKIWIGWNNLDKIFYSIILFIFISLLLSKKIQLKYSKRSMIGILCLYCGMSYINKSPFGPQNILITSLFAFVLFIKDIDKVQSMHYITKWFAYLMVPSLITYWLVQLHIVSPLGTMIYGLGEDIVFRNPDYCIRQNYIFYMYAPHFYGIRFNGPFVEPGHLGMMVAFLLFCNKFDFSKKYNIINLIALLHTFSLAGYVLAFMGYLMVILYLGLLKSRTLLLYFLIPFIVITFLYPIANDNKYIRELIMERLEYKKDRGIVGNNRTSDNIINYRDKMLSRDNPELIMNGYSDKKWDLIIEEGKGFKGTGFTVAMVHYGLLGIVAMMLFYFFYLVYSKEKKFALFALLFVLALFWQRTYPFWFSWIICYTYGIVFIEYENLKQKYMLFLDKDFKDENRNNDISSGT